MIDRNTKNCPVCGRLMVLKRSRVKRLDAGRWKGKSYPERANPNLGREYNTCSDRACGSFGWTEPQAVGDPESNQKQAATQRKRKPRASAQHGNPATGEGYESAMAKRAAAVQADVAEAEARAAALREAAGAEAKGLAEMAAREARANLEVERANALKADFKARMTAKMEKAKQARLPQEPEVMELDDVRAMFSAPPA